MGSTASRRPRSGVGRMREGLQCPEIACFLRVHHSPVWRLAREHNRDHGILKSSPPPEGDLALSKPY